MEKAFRATDEGRRDQPQQRDWSMRDGSERELCGEQPDSRLLVNSRRGYKRGIRFEWSLLVT